MIKRIWAIGLVLTLALSVTPALAAGVEDRFPATNQYPGYADVPAGIWYEANAKLCYETGLITGTDIGFQPQRYMKVSEVAVIAARIHDILGGGDGKLPASEPWYQSAVDALHALGVTGLDRPEIDATRGDFLSMLSAVVSDDLLTPINTVVTLPDADNPAVLRFYNAGILTGTDKYGTFHSGNSLTRMEGAAMVSRVVRENLRMTFSPADYTPFKAAGVTPDTLFFTSGKTAGDYLPAALELIASLEHACQSQGIDFNWFHTVGEQTFLSYVKENTLSQLDVVNESGTAAYQNFDLQVFYSRYIDLKGTLR